MTDTLPEIREFLEQSNTPFEVWDCDPALADTDRFCEHYGISPEHSANTILVKTKKGDTRYAACVLLAIHRLNVNHTVRKRLETRKASFATAQETREITGMEIGGVTPLNLPDGIPIWVDEQVMKREYIILGGGNRTSKLKVSPLIFSLLTNAETVPHLAS